MDKKKQRLLIGIGFAIVGYFVFKKYGVKWFAPKLAQATSKDEAQANFLNADGNGGFVAKRYDASRNATWISYQNSDVVGYWQSGKIKEGTPIHGLN
jgi:hypothetical protein